jgi:GT2 family glycosyltransferase
MTDKSPTTTATENEGIETPQEAVLLIHSAGDRGVAKDWHESIQALGLETWSPQAGKDAMDIGDLGVILCEFLERHAGRPLLILRAGLAVDRALIAALVRLAKNQGEVAAVTALSNADPGLNPFCGLPEPAGGNLYRSADWARLVRLLGPGGLHRHRHWPRHLVLLSASAVTALAHKGLRAEQALSRLRSQGGGLLLDDRMFVHDPASPLGHDHPLEPHEEQRPDSWGLLSERLDEWLRAFDDQAPEMPRADRPVTLHATHSWGGGVAQWVGSFIEADTDTTNFQLRSEGPQTGQGTGQRLSLYLGNWLESPVASWWLQPPVLSTDEDNSQYREILEEIKERYRVGRIIVSSLVGHSLDIFRTGLPTMQVLHDFYPAWPLLGVHPEPYYREEDSGGLSTAMQEHRLLPDLRGRDAAAWSALGARWRDCLSSNEVQAIAPSQSVADMLSLLDPAWSGLNIEIIPHGTPPLPDQPPVRPREREDGKLRLLVPGRIQEGKGQSLLLEALPELTRFAQVYLVGAGKAGEAFFGRNGVDVILQYKREELPSLLAQIGPHAAALLSVVPETFSYTLSEMQYLGIPVVATRVGSFAERIMPGQTGWLIEPTAEQLVSQLQSLSDQRAELERVRKGLLELEQQDTAGMVRRYARFLVPRAEGRRAARAPGNDHAQRASISSRQVRLKSENRQLAEQAARLKSEIKSRTVWAEERERALQEEQRQRAEWVEKLETRLEEQKEQSARWISSLESQLAERFEELQEAREAFEWAKGAVIEAEESLAHEQASHEQTRGHLSRLRIKHQTVLASSSWRITRPMRVARRMLANAHQARAWNPARWPLLFSQSVRTLKTQGLRGAMTRAQQSQKQSLPPEPFETDQIESVGDPQPPLQLPRSDQPRVSIVIPVYNQWAYTAACLRSLAEAECRSSFEVIVVDDQSSDETAEQLREVEGLIRIRNDENLGFIDSCNRGAEAARGEYLVMLNNDTQVLDGWLDALLETFKRFPDTGMAGARLVYPDGKLQEAGGIVFGDGTGWNYGRGDDAQRPEYLYTREVDYCSGACIMIPLSLYRELGGFDERYKPAYYEDNDLAFQVREQGYKVRVQPAATIVHHEGVSSGTDLNSGIKRYQTVNQEKFLRRWSDVLATHPDPIDDPDDGRALRRARDHRLKGRVLVIDAYTPEPDQDSGSVRLRYLLDCFAQLGYGVTFFADNRGHAGSYSQDMQQAGIEVLYNPWILSLHDFFRERGEEFSFVFISRHYVAANYLSLIERYCPGAKFLFDTVDLHYLREQRLAELEDSLPLKRTASQTRRSEMAVISAADATLVLSPVEKTVLAQDAPDARVHVISNIHEITGSRRPFSERKDIYFVGGYQHPPNIDAAMWFVRRIWPQVHKALPDLTFHLIGSKAPEQVRSLHGDGVIFHGYVESMDPWLDGCRLAVAPLRYGAGIKGKVNMSMAHGQPVVATPMAVEGMFAKEGEDVLVAEGEEEFAEAIIRLYGDEALWNRISAGGIENVRRYFSVDTARSSLKALLEALG